MNEPPLKWKKNYGFLIIKVTDGSDNLPITLTWNFNLTIFHKYQFYVFLLTLYTNKLRFSSILRTLAILEICTTNETNEIKNCVIITWFSTHPAYQTTFSFYQTGKHLKLIIFTNWTQKTIFFEVKRSSMNNGTENKIFIMIFSLSFNYCRWPYCPIYFECWIS